MMTCNKNVRKHDIIFFIFIGLLVFLPVIGLGDKLGLYHDAINSEYAGQMILSPNNGLYWYHYISFPFLSQIYRGIPSLWISIAGTLLTGTTSVLQHNIETTLVLFACLVTFYFLLEVFSVKKQIRMLVTLILSVLPSLFTTTLTQYHVGLPGVLFSMCSGLLYIKWRDDREDKKLILSAIFMGLAFYTYYCFLFLIPIYIIFLFIDQCSAKERMKQGLIFVSGFLSGCVLYFVGYTEIFLRSLEQFKNSDSKRIIVSMIAAIFVWTVSFLIYLWLKAEKWKPVICICILTVLVGIIWLWIILPQIRTVYSNIPTHVERLSIGGRFKLVFEFIENILTGRKAELLIYNEIYARFLSLFKVLFLVTDFVYVWIIVKNRTKLLHEKVCVLSLVFMIYIICSIVVVGKQGPQHYLPLLFLMFLIFGIQLDYIFRNIRTTPKLEIYLKKAGILLLLVCMIINIGNKYAIIHQIEKTGGRGYCTHQLNELAYEALDRKTEGIKEIYLFPEWGFYASFSYLTHNDISYWVCDVNAETIKYFQNLGYERFIICYWDNKNTGLYKRALMNAVSGGLQEKTYYQRDGQVAFYMLCS